MAAALTESQLTGTWGMGETEDFVRGLKRWDRIVGYITLVVMNVAQIIVLLMKGEIQPRDLIYTIERNQAPIFTPLYRLWDDDSLRPPLHPSQDVAFYFCKSLTEYERKFIGEALPTFFNSQYDTKVIIHGWGNWSPYSYYWNLTVGALANPASDLGPYNIIYVQWKFPSRFPLYNSALNYVPGVAVQVAQLIKYIVEIGNIDFYKVHLIGHSLGAHVAGVASKRTKELTILNVANTTLKRITALDPAVPLISFEPLRDRLTAHDADFVDVIHSNGQNARTTPALGLYAAIGDADFYPNGGYEQAGCRKQYPILPLYCNHLRAVEFFFESVRRQDSLFTSVLCNDFPQFKRGYCENNAKVSMGIRTPSGTSGTYFLYTRETYPFSMN